MSKPARNITTYKDYYYTYSSPSVGTVVVGPTTVAIKHDVCALTAENPVGIAKRRRGEAVFLPPLYYDRSVERDEILFGFRQSVDVNPRYSYTYAGYLPTMQPLNPVQYSMLVEAWNNAERKALNKLKNSNVNFAQFFVEAHQVTSMFAKTSKSVADGLRKMKKGDVVGALKAVGYGTNNRQRQRAARRVRSKGKEIEQSMPAGIGEFSSGAAKTAASQWLAAAFGWEPLLSDLDGTARLLAERSTQDTKRTRFNVRALSKQKIDNYSNTGVPPYDTYINSQKGYIGALVRLDFYFKNTQLASLSADGLTNPAALAWEQVPFSFLADYFIGIGGWLDNLDSSLGKEFVGGSATLFERWTSLYEARSSGVVPGSHSFSSYEGRKRTMTKMQRIPYGSFPDPTLITLAIKNPLNSRKHTANSVALVTSAVGSYLRPR